MTSIWTRLLVFEARPNIHGEGDDDSVDGNIPDLEPAPVFLQEGHGTKAVLGQCPGQVQVDI